MIEVLESQIGRNPLVIEKIAEQLPTKNLFLLRLTCKMWNQKFTPQLRMKHSPISLTPTELWTGWINLALQHYTKTVQIRQTLPYTRYFIELGRGSEEIPNFQKFLTKFESTITRLDLFWTCCRQFTPIELGKLVFERAPFLVWLNLTVVGTHIRGPEVGPPNPSFTKPNLNLKKLIADTGDSSNRTCTSFIRLLEDVIKQSPHLESVNLCDSSGLPVLTRIKESVADLGKLKTLTLTRTSVTLLKLLVELGGRSTNALKLEKFSTIVQYNWSGGEQDGLIVNQVNPVGVDIHEASELLYRFLITQSLTLRKLDIELRDSHRGVLGSRPDVPFQFPRLMDLHIFRLSTNEARLAYGGTSFADTFPKLRHFQFCYLPTVCNKVHTGQFWGPNLEDDVSRLFHSGVTELHLRLNCPEQLVQWPSRFPSVTHLILVEFPWSGKVKEKAKDCWTLWPKLVKLNNITRPATMEEPSRV